MEYSHEVQNMCCVAKGPNHGPAPIPEEGGVGLVIVIADLVVHSSRIVVADFMVAAQEDDGAFCTVDGVGQGVNHA